ncbi:MAG TPA: cytochrome c family protein [Rhizomicrobium sp.]|jgi:cytochrome c|nr:cytochrome c family protein [Rhizomicrobium sp.]
MSYGKIAAVSLMAVGLLSSQAFADGDATKGKAVFARCAICHNVEKDGGNGVGPNLFGIAGRKSATAEGFNYSGAMKAANLTWTDENLAKYIAGPAKMVPGNKMAFGGIAQKSQIADVIAYLHTLK